MGPKGMSLLIALYGGGLESEFSGGLLKISPGRDGGGGLVSVWRQLLASLGERFVVMRSSIRMRTLAADNLASGSSSQHSWIVSTTVLSP